MTREEFNNNSYLVNNNALYNKHTEHISTTEPLYLDGMPGSDNLIHKKPVDSGGDTPLKTHVAIPLEENSPLFAFGIVSEEHDIQVLRIFVYKSNGHVLGVNASGVIQEDTGISSSTTVLNGYKDIANAQGYNIVGASVNINDYNLGDTVEDWDAYEKIEIPAPPIPVGNYLVYDIDRGSLFNITEEGIFVYAQTNELAYIIKTDGEVIETIPISSYPPAFEGFLNSLNEVLGTDYPIGNVQRIVSPSLIGNNIKNTVGTYELIEVT